MKSEKNISGLFEKIENMPIFRHVDNRTIIICSVTETKNLLLTLKPNCL
jgi:hypothetical protein